MNASNENCELRVPEEELAWEDDLTTYAGSPFTGIGYFATADGKMLTETRYVDGLRSGLCLEWYPTGGLKSMHFANRGRGPDESIKWHEGGRVKSVRHWHFGIELDHCEWTENGELIVQRALSPEDTAARAYIGRMSHIHK